MAASQKLTRVVGSLCRQYDEWVKIGANEVVLEWIRHGVRIPWITTPSETHNQNRPMTEEQMAFVDGEVARLLEGGAIQRAKGAVCISSLGVVPKKNGKLRLIIDLRAVNSHIAAPHFQFEDVKIVSQIVETGDLMVSWDLQDGYHHLSIHPEDRKFLGFKWRGMVYVYTVLPFGMNASPYIFVKTVRPVLRYLRENGCRVTAYMDDFLLLGSSEEINRSTEFALELMARLGWSINSEKSVLYPCQEIEHIGFIIDTKETPYFRLSPKKCAAMKHEIRRAINSRQISARNLARIAGLCISTVRVIFPGKLQLRNVYRLLATKRSWKDRLILDSGAIADLRWWLDSLNHWNGQVVKHRLPEMTMATDASSVGWGAVLGSRQASGAWDPELARMHSNYRELFAVLMGLHSFRSALGGITVELLSDNVTTVAYINRFGGRHSNLMEVTR